MKTLQEKIQEADFRAQDWLHKANVKRENGKDDSKEMDKAQYWLDKLNELEGLADA